MASPTLMQIITGSGSSPDPEVGEFAPLAGSVQAQRRRDNASPYLSLTRSTALWTLLQIRTDISDILRPHGLNANDLGAILRITATTLKPEPPGDVELHDDFAKAVRRYLADPPLPPVFSLADLAAAILHAARDDTRSGELPDRLRRLNVDLPRAIDAIDAFVQAGRTAGSIPRLPLVSEVDPYDFGVHTGADGPRGRNLNPYVARDADRAIDDLLGRERSVIVTAAPRAGATRTVYEALNRVVPSAQVYVAPRAGEFSPEELQSIPTQDACVLWIDKLGSQWGVLGPRLARAVTNWLAQENRWFVAVHYDGDDPEVLDRLRTQTVRIDGKLSTQELASEQLVYGNAAVTELIGGNPPQQDVDGNETTAPADSERLAGGTDSDLVDPTLGIPLERDRLNVKDYVTMLATVMADKDTPMPLSVGLFGEWGSGKSYFMGLLRGQVEALGRQDPDRYHADIVQLGFNAWHYSDSNLWASIGDAIFSQLTDPGTTGEDRAAELQRELAANNERRQELEAATERAQQEVANLERGIQRARQAKGVRAKAVLTAIANEPTVNQEFDKAFRKLGVTKDVARAKVLASDLTGTKEDLAVVRRRVTGWRISAALLAIAAVLAVVVLVVGLSSSWTKSQLTGTLAFLGTIIGVASVVMRRVHSGLRSLSTLISDIDNRSQQQTNKELARELEALRAATANEQVLRAQLDDVIVRAGELGTELAQASPGQRLYRFVSERAESDDYRGQLGLISTIRKDFEQLIELMDRWNDSGDETPTPIRRIILYIDDLDRCSPTQVVEVLQAVHLLLALDLFVVVVGVDPRWLLRSLGREFRSTLTQAQEPDQDWSLSTPQDYLEKIFNIPFILPAMDPANFESLLRGLADGKPRIETTDQRQNGPRPREEQHPVVQAGQAAATGPAIQAPIAVAESHSLVATLQRGEVDRGAPLTDPEIKMLAALAPLVRTPRSAKRLLNLYRLLRSTRDPSPTGSFLGTDGKSGEFQAVAVLLGLLTGYPQLMGDLLLGRPGGLIFRSPGGSWQSFVESLEPPADGRSNAVAENLDEAAADEWRRLVVNLAPSTELVDLEGLEAFQRWAPRVARFSFRLAPVVLDRRAPRPGSRTQQNGANAAEAQAADPVGA